MSDSSQQGTIVINSNRNMELIDITSMVTKIPEKNAIKDGILHLFNPHTTAGLTINEGADPDVRDDIVAGLMRVVPMHHDYKHAEGNSPSHIMASLMGSSVTLFINNGILCLGTWQKIYFCEFDGPRARKVFYRITS